MAVYCGFKRDYFHRCKEVECDERKCNNYIKSYSGKDYLEQFWEVYNRFKYTDKKDVLDMKFIYGHCQTCDNDYDCIAWDAITILRVIKRKLNYKVEQHEFLEAIIIMKVLGVKIPKHVKRKYNRLLRNGTFKQKLEDSYLNYKYERLRETVCKSI